VSRSSRRHRGRQDGLRIPRRILPLLIAGVGLLLLGGIVALLGVGSSGGDASGGTPRLVVEQEVFNYGDVALNTPITTTFVLRNEGDGVLRILETPQVEVREGC